MTPKNPCIFRVYTVAGEPDDQLVVLTIGALGGVGRGRGGRRPGRRADRERGDREAAGLEPNEAITSETPYVTAPSSRRCDDDAGSYGTGRQP
jgi:hypothetical protein